MTKIFILLLFVSLNSYALVDMESKTYTQSWNDLKGFIETRTYKANSEGVFGKNWCSVLDLESECSFQKMSKSEISELKLKFDVKKNKVSQFSINNLVYKVKYDKKRVSGILSKDNKILASFEYDKKGDLVSAKNELDSVIQYEYSANGSLIKTIFPDKSFKSISYRGDDVVSFVDRDGCVEDYTYESKEGYSKSTAFKTCEDKIVSHLVFEFWKNKSELQRIKSTTNGVVKDTFYNKNKQPIKFLEKDRTMDIEYFQNGLVKTISHESAKNHFSYNKNNKVSKVLNVTSKNQESEETLFEYVDGKMKVVKHSSGMRLDVDYDIKKRIVNMKSKNGLSLDIDIIYNELVNKPSAVELKGVGKIYIKYADSGEILKVESLQGEKVGSKVAKALDLLLSFMNVAENINNKHILNKE